MEQEEKIFSIIREVYEYCNGDFVECVRILGLTVIKNSLSEEFVNGIFEIYRKNDLTVEDVTELLRSVRRRYDLRTEHIVLACINEMSIEEYKRSRRCNIEINDYDFRVSRRCHCDELKEHLLRYAIRDVEDLVKYLKETDKDELNDDGICAQEFLSGKGVDDFLESVVRDGYCQITPKEFREEVTRRFAKYWISLNQIRKWLEKKKISVKVLIKIANKEDYISADDIIAGMNDSMRGKAQPSKEEEIEMPPIEDTVIEKPQPEDTVIETPQPKGDNGGVDFFRQIVQEGSLRSKIQNLVVKLLEYYTPIAEVLLRDDGNMDEIERVAYALESNRNNFGEEESQEVQRIYKECDVTLEDVNKYRQNFQDTKQLVIAVSCGMLPGELGVGDKNIENYEQLLESIRVIYSSDINSNLRKSEMSKCGKVYRQVLEVKRGCSPLREGLEFEIRKLVVKLLDYCIPREEELLASSADRDVIDWVRVALEDGWNNLKDAEAQAVQQMYEECDLCRNEVLRFLIDNTRGATIMMIEAASRGMTIEELFEEEKKFNEEEKKFNEEKWQQWRTCIKAIYSGKTEMLEMEGCEDIFRQVLETRKVMIQSGIIEGKTGEIKPVDAAYVLAQGITFEQAMCGMPEQTEAVKIEGDIEING